ncbi:MULTISPECIES: hypothetical protein [unclassified Streptomyces]|uniref:hypothetical protein n=1 Tax=unclassified Streptomyces TaxID=2593676 RepID=UPI0036552EA4
MQSSRAAAAVSSAFDDPNLIAYGGLEPVVRPAERCGLPKLAGEHVRLPASKDGTGAFPAAKLMWTSPSCSARCMHRRPSDAP